MKKIVVLAAITVSLLSCFFPFPCIAGQANLRINCTVHSPYEAFFVRLLEEVCKHNNVILKRNTPPVGRSLIHANQGIDDGDGPRIAGLSSAYPDIVPVPEPFGEFNFGAFARSPDIIINDWTDLKDLNVAYIHGWKIFDNQVKTAKFGVENL